MGSHKFHGNPYYYVLQSLCMHLISMHIWYLIGAKPHIELKPVYLMKKGARINITSCVTYSIQTHSFWIFHPKKSNKSIIFNSTSNYKLKNGTNCYYLGFMNISQENEGIYNFVSRTKCKMSRKETIVIVLHSTYFIMCTVNQC